MTGTMPQATAGVALHLRRERAKTAHCILRMRVQAVRAEIDTNDGDCVHGMACSEDPSPA